MEFEKGYNPYNKVKFGSWEDNLEPYVKVRVSYGMYDHLENNTIESVYFKDLKDAFKYIHDDKKVDDDEPKIYHIVETYEYDAKDDCYYYEEYEVHYHRNGKIFLKAF